MTRIRSKGRRALYTLAAIVVSSLAIPLGPTAAQADDGNRTPRENELPSQPTGPVYAVGMFELADGIDRAQFDHYYAKIQGVLGRYCARFLTTSPIEILGNLPNPALPPTTVDLTADFITIAEFPDRSAFERFRKDPRARKLRQAWSAKLADEVRFLGVLAPDFQFPVIGTFPFRDDPAFLLINSMQLDATNPNTLPSFGAYAEQAIPMVMARGTQFYAVIVPVEVLEGEYDDDFLFITEWASRDAFDAHHADEKFLSIVHLRNDVLTRWIEAEAVVGEPPVGGHDEDHDDDEWSQ